MTAAIARRGRQHGPVKPGAACAIEKAIRATYDATDYLHRPRIADPVLLRELRRTYAAHERALLRAVVDAVTGDLLRAHQTTRHRCRRVLKGVVRLARELAERTGRLEPLVLINHPLLTSWANRAGDEMSIPTMRRALHCLVEAKIFLYDCGRELHPSVFSLPTLVDEHPERTRASLLEVGSDLPRWAEPMRQTLLHSQPSARVFDLAAHRELYEVRRELRKARAAEAVAAWKEQRRISKDAYAAICSLGSAEPDAETPRPDAELEGGGCDHGDHRNSGSSPSCVSTPSASSSRSQESGPPPAAEDLPEGACGAVADLSAFPGRPERKPPPAPRDLSKARELLEAARAAQREAALAERPAQTIPAHQSEAGKGRPKNVQKSSGQPRPSGAFSSSGELCGPPGAKLAIVRTGPEPSGHRDSGPLSLRERGPPDS